MDDVIRFLHLTSAAVWVGGMVTMAVVVPSMRRSGADIEHIRAAARGFAVAAWAAMGVAVATGIAQLIRLSIPAQGNTPLAVKLLLVGLAVAFAWAHQMFGRDLPAGIRGAIQATLLVLGLAIVWAAVLL